jgi:peptide/nickel transport system substrate-binding protein
MLAVSRNLANGEEDPYYTHNSLMVWDSLVMLNEELEPAPQLAKSWSLSGDQLSWTFELREGIFFTDGTPFDADAVVANIDRLMQISPRRSPFFSLTIARSYGDLAGASKTAEGNVEYQLNSPNPSMIFTMSNFFSAMFSPDSFTENGDFTGIPATTGRFKLADWERDQFILLERNEDY